MGEPMELMDRSATEEYWKSVDPDVNGMLGGYGDLSPLDERDSVKFLSRYFADRPCRLALDCGAGIGRVSRNVLLKLFSRVSLLECTASFIDEARRALPKEKVLHLHNKPIQELRPLDDEGGQYDLVWFQWVLCYVEDAELVRILREARKFLAEGGVIGVKENIVAGDSEREFDPLDSSVIRNDAEFKSIFEGAGLDLVSVARQRSFPGHLYPVKMYLLKPCS